MTASAAEEQGPREQIDEAEYRQADRESQIGEQWSPP
jgi:hypothetical protein